MEISRRAMIATAAAATAVAAIAPTAAEPITGAVVRRAVPIGFLSAISRHEDGSALLEIVSAAGRSVGKSGAAVVTLRSKYDVAIGPEHRFLTTDLELGQLMGLDTDNMLIVPMGREPYTRLERDDA